MYAWLKAIKAKIVSKIDTFMKEHPASLEERIDWAAHTVVRCMEAKFHFNDISPLKLNFIDEDIRGVSVTKAKEALISQGYQIKHEGGLMYPKAGFSKG